MAVHKIQTQAIITSRQQSSKENPQPVTDWLIFDEKHFKFGFLNVAYSQIERAELKSRGVILFRERYLIVEDENRRYEFGPLDSVGFLKKLPIKLKKN